MEPRIKNGWLKSNYYLCQYGCITGLGTGYWSCISNVTVGG